jgi:hypothetical protein
LASWAASLGSSALASTERMLVSPLVTICTAVSTEARVIPWSTRRAVAAAASGDSTSAAAVCTVRVVSPLSPRRTSTPSKVVSVASTGVTSSWALAW